MYMYFKCFLNFRSVNHLSTYYMLFPREIKPSNISHKHRYLLCYCSIEQVLQNYSRHWDPNCLISTKISYKGVVQNKTSLQFKVNTTIWNMRVWKRVKNDVVVKPVKSLRCYNFCARVEHKKWIYIQGLSITHFTDS